MIEAKLTLEDLAVGGEIRCDGVLATGTRRCQGGPC